MGVIAQRYFSISTYLPTYISYEIHLDHLATRVVILLLPKFPRLLHTYDFHTYYVVCTYVFGTILILRQNILGLFQSHPSAHYVSKNVVHAVYEQKFPFSEPTHPVLLLTDVILEWSLEITRYVHTSYTTNCHRG